MVGGQPRRCRYGEWMLVITHHRLPLPGFATTSESLAAARDALAVLALRPGWRRGRLARAVDDPDLLLLVQEWDDAGSCRRALSAHEVRIAAGRFLQTAADEPSAYEVLQWRDGAEVLDAPSAIAADGGDVGLGEAAQPYVLRGDFS